MKKALKLVLVLSMVLALTVTAFAADSPTTKTVSNYSNANQVGTVTTAADSGVSVRVANPSQDLAAANQNTAKELVAKTGRSIVAFLDSFDILVSKNGQPVHEGVDVNVTFQNLQQYVGKYLNVIENSNGVQRVAYSGPITADQQTVTFKTFSTFTPVITDAPMQSATSPATSQSTLTITLIGMAFLALAGVVVAAKRRSVEQ